VEMLIYLYSNKYNISVSCFILFVNDL